MFRKYSAVGRFKWQADIGLFGNSGVYDFMPAKYHIFASMQWNYSRFCNLSQPSTIPFYRCQFLTNCYEFQCQTSYFYSSVSIIFSMALDLYSSCIYWFDLIISHPSLLTRSSDRQSITANFYYIFWRHSKLNWICCVGDLISLQWKFAHVFGNKCKYFRYQSGIFLIKKTKERREKKIGFKLTLKYD